MNRSELVKAAKELNEVLDLVTGISIKEKTPELEEKIIEAAELIEEGDNISDSTMAVINALLHRDSEEDEGGELAPEHEEVSERVPEPKPKASKKKGGAKAKAAEPKVEEPVDFGKEKGEFGWRKNSSIHFVASMIVRGASKEQIVREVAARFGKDERLAASRYDTTLKALKSKGFVEKAKPSKK